MDRRFRRKRPSGRFFLYKNIQNLAHVRKNHYLCSRKGEYKDRVGEGEMKTVYVFDLGGVLIKLNVGRCMRAFEALI